MEQAVGHIRFSPRAKDWTAPTPRFASRLIRVGMIDLSIALGLFFVGEAAARLFFPGLSKYVYTERVTGGHPVLFNSLGLRDREFPIEPPGDELRILCLGNSVTFGSGVAMEQTYPKQLERILAERTGRPCLGINAGAQGRSLGEAAEFVTEMGARIQPDVVVLGFSPSMLARVASDHPGGENETDVSEVIQPQRFQRPKSVVETMRAAVVRAVHRSYVLSWTNYGLRKAYYGWGAIRENVSARVGAVFAYAFDAPKVDFKEVESAFDHFEDDLARLFHAVRRRGLKLVVIGIPPRFEISDLAVDNERRFDLRRIRISPLDRVSLMCGRLGIPFVDARPPLRRARQEMLAGSRPWDDLYVPLDHTHLSPVGLGIVASSVPSLLCDTALATERFESPRGGRQIGAGLDGPAAETDQ